MSEPVLTAIENNGSLEIHIHRKLNVEEFSSILAVVASGLDTDNTSPIEVQQAVMSAMMQTANG